MITKTNEAEGHRPMTPAPRLYYVTRRYVCDDVHEVYATSRQEALEKWAEVEPHSKIIKNYKLKAKVAPRPTST